MNRRNAIARLAALFGAGVAAPLVKLAEVDASETVGYLSTGDESQFTGTLTTTGTFTASSSTSGFVVWIDGKKYTVPVVAF